VKGGAVAILPDEKAHLPQESQLQQEIIDLWDRHRGTPPKDGFRAE
jgi:hypothetical protein